MTEMDKTFVKICELKINQYDDRIKLVGILASAGYTVSIKEEKGDSYLLTNYYVVIEKGE